ncbi:MAG: isochorismatase family protein [Actinobacteria bacterium]|nr:isochorismatase family protein [Actinomycetota bacterium]
MSPEQVRNALIVVDAQQGFDDPVWGNRNNQRAEQNIRTLLTAWRAVEQPVVLVRHDSVTPRSPLRPGQPGNDLLPGINGTHDLFVTKTVNSAFYGTPDLDEWLRAERIDHVTICGITTNHCCETTARMAGNLGYEVSFVIDATFTFDRLDPDGLVVSAEDLSRITATNLHGEFATVVTTAEAEHRLLATL